MPLTMLSDSLPLVEWGMLQNDLARFLEKVTSTNGGCWLWGGHRHKRGYGSFYFRGKDFRAHRASWILHKGEIPDGLLVCHSCDTPACVNPGHLFLGTAKENAQDMVAKKRCFGEAQGSAKLRNEQVIEIREKYERGAKQTHLAREYGVNHSLVSLIVRKKRWAHL